MNPAALVTLNLLTVYRKQLHRSEVNPAAIVALNFQIDYKNPLVSWEVNHAAIVALNFLIVYRKPLHQQTSESWTSFFFKLSYSLQKGDPPEAK